MTMELLFRSCFVLMSKLITESHPECSREW
jgi:hypothetical protein